MTTYDVSDAELRDQTRRRDAQAIPPFEARYAEPESWIDALVRDYAREAIADNIVWAGVTGAPATLEQAYGRWVPGAGREAYGYRLRYVSAAYIARGQITALSAFCGVIYAGDANPTGARVLTEVTALRINQTAWKVQKALSGLPGLEVRNGSALHLHNLDGGAWQAHPNESIEALPELVCAVCGAKLHWSNDHYRDVTGAFEIYDNVPCPSCGATGPVARRRRLPSCHRRPPGRDRQRYWRRAYPPKRVTAQPDSRSAWSPWPRARWYSSAPCRPSAWPRRRNSRRAAGRSAR